jgi:hypothetical protein
MGRGREDRARRPLENERGGTSEQKQTLVRRSDARARTSLPLISTQLGTDPDQLLVNCN